MEFRFNLNELFQEPCVEIGNTLIPPGFTGDKRALWDTQSKVTQIVNAMGEASAHAQGLSKPITTADRLRNSEHRLYLLIDQAANNGKGAVTGMLKTGQKGLYVFDREGQHYQVSPPCVLDFYIHESRQRTGFGRRLFEHMLEREKLEPNKMAIDRPSDKFLGFLNKHYGLHTPVKQMNNYVVFDGFFPTLAATPNKMPTDKSPSKKQSANGLQQSYHSSPYGRYAAAHPACSMGQIIHNDSPVINRNQEPTGVKSEPVVTRIQDGLDRYNNVYGNQLAWQATQSVPNMPFAQNQYLYSQNNAMQQNPNYYYMAQGDATSQNMPQTYYQQIPSPQIVQQPIRTKEPLIPQSFDGTPKKMPHAAQSMPAQGDRRQIPAPFALQSSISAPNYYQQHPQNANFVQNFASNQQPTVQQNVAHMNQMNPQQIENEVTNQMMQMNPIGNQNPGVIQQSYNDGTNQMVPITNQNQTNQGGTQMIPTMINQNQSDPMNPTINQNQMNPTVNNPNQINTMNYQNQSDQGASYMNPTINQNQMNPNQMNPALNPNPTKNFSQMNLNQVTSQVQLSPENQNSIIPSMVNQNQNSQHIMPNAVHSQQIIPNTVHSQQIISNTVHSQQQQYLNNQINTYPQMSNQFENMAMQPTGNNQQNFINTDQGQQPGQSIPQLTNAVPQPVREDARVPCYENEVDHSKGYPPQQPHNPAQSTTNGRTPSKADRPNSLNIEINDDEELFKLKLEPEEGHHDHLDHGDDIDSFDGDAIDAIEEEIRKVEIAPKASTPLSAGSKSPGIEAAGYVTPGRNTPGMKTDQGYYDLKFYHNKLW